MRLKCKIKVRMNSSLLLGKESIVIVELIEMEDIIHLLILAMEYSKDQVINLIND